MNLTYPFIIHLHFNIDLLSVNKLFLCFVVVGHSTSSSSSRLELLRLFVSEGNSLINSGKVLSYISPSSRFHLRSVAYDAMRYDDGVNGATTMRMPGPFELFVRASCCLFVPAACHAHIDSVEIPLFSPSFAFSSVAQRWLLPLV